MCYGNTCDYYSHPPLQIVDIGNGCEAFSTSIYIPAKSELTATMQSLTRSHSFWIIIFSIQMSPTLWFGIKQILLLLTKMK